MLSIAVMLLVKRIKEEKDKVTLLLENIDYEGIVISGKKNPCYFWSLNKGVLFV